MQQQPKNDPKTVPAEPDSWEADQEQRGYYYDDAHGYQIYQEEEQEKESEVPAAIWTIGHSTRTMAEFVELLQANRIEVVADVRSFPGSRKFPHFNAESLGPSLNEAGIGYEMIGQLGGRRRPRPDSRNTVWRHEAFRAYADYMETGDFGEGIDQLLRIAGHRRTAIMCAEAVWWRCHRSMIADHLKSKGIVVEHIIDDDKTTVHPYTSAAKIKGGQLVYGPADE
jgi:uncharacterized protein (DUF488 family)